MRISKLFVIGLLAVCFSVSALAQEYTVENQQIDDVKAVIATVESVREVTARARIQGTLSMLAVKEGDRVSAGEKIALIGDPKLAIRGQGLEAHIQAAQSAFDKSKLDYSRALELRNAGYGTQVKLDDAKSALEVAENNLKAAKSEQQVVMQQSVEGAVLAPSAGRVLKVPVAVGSVVMAGETIATLSQENYILRLELPERHARFLKAGDQVQIGSRGMQPDSIASMRTGIVRLVYPEIKNGRVIADVSVADLGDYFVGERTRAYVATGQRVALMLPAEYIFRRAGVEFVRLKSGEEIVVQSGQKIGDNIEVLSGLKANDILVKP